MLERLLDISIMYVLQLKQQLHKLVFLWFLILPIQFSLLIFIFLNHPLHLDNGSPISMAILRVGSILNGNAIVRTVIILQLFISFGLLLSFIIYASLKAPFGCIDRHRSKMDLLINLNICLILVSELILPLTITFFTREFLELATEDHPHNIKYAWAVPISLLTILPHIIINSRVRFQGVFLSVLPAIYSSRMSGLETVTLFCAIGTSIYCYFKDDNIEGMLIYGRNLRKILHLQMVAVLGWLLIEILLDSSPSTISYINLLSMMVVTAVIGGVVAEFKVHDLPKITALCKYVEQREESESSLEDVLHRQKIATDFIHECKNQGQMSEQLKELSHKKLPEWEQADWMQLVKEMILKQYREDPTLEKGTYMVKCHLMVGNDLYGLLELMQELDAKHSKNSISNKYELVKIKLKVQEMWIKKEGLSAILNPLTTLEIDRLSIEFYREARLQIERISGFWACISRREFSQIEKIMSKIQTSFEKLKKLLAVLEGISEAPRERLLFESLYLLILNKNETVANVHEEPSVMSDFIQLNQEKIERISLKLSTDLGYKSEEWNRLPIQHIMPFGFYRSVLTEIKESNKTKVEIPFVLPLMCANRTVTLRTLTCYVEIDACLGYRFLYQFGSLELGDSCFIVYDMETNLIEGYSRLFLQKYQIDKKTLDGKIATKSLNSEDLFKDIELLETGTREKLIGSTDSEFNCYIWPKAYKKRGVPDKFYEVRISVIEAHKNILLIKVLEGHRAKTGIINQEERVSLEARARLSGGVDSEFCVLENPYNPKITMKKMELLKPSNKSLKFFSVSLMFFAIFVLVLQNICFIAVNFSTYDRRQQNEQEYVQVYEYYKYLTMSYQSYYLHYLVSANKEKVDQFGIDADQLEEEISLELKHSNHQFQTLYLSNLLRGKLQPIPYQLQFGYMNISVDTSTTNLFDFSQNLALPPNSSLAFTLSNYPSFHKIISRTKEIFEGIEWRAHEPTTMKVIIYCFCATIFIASCISIFLLVKIANFLTEIERIFTLLNPKQLKSSKQRLAKLHEEFLELNNDCIKCGSTEEDPPKEAQIMSQISDSSIEGLELQNEQAGILEDEESEVSLDNQPGIEKSCFNVCQSMKLPIFLLLGFCASVLSLWQIDANQREVIGHNQLFLFHIHNLQNEVETIRNIASLYHVLILTDEEAVNEAYNSSSDFVYPSTPTEGLFTWQKRNSIVYEPMPAFFDSFYEQYLTQRNGNLCTQVAQAVIRTNCTQLLSGIMRYGISKSIDTLYMTLKQVKDIGVDGLFVQLPELAYPTFQEVIDTQKIFLSLTERNMKRLVSDEYKFKSYTRAQDIGIVLTGISVSIFLGVLTAWISNKLDLKCRVGVGYFLILPNEVMIEPEVLDHIRRNNILDNISSL